MSKRGIHFSHTILRQNPRLFYFQETPKFRPPDAKYLPVTIVKDLQMTAGSYRFTCFTYIIGMYLMDGQLSND